MSVDLPAHRQCRAAARSIASVDLDLARDIVQLIKIGLEASIRHPLEVVYARPNNEAAWWDNSRAPIARLRGRRPGEDHCAHAEAVAAKIGPEPVGDCARRHFWRLGIHQRLKRAGP